MLIDLQHSYLGGVSEFNDSIEEKRTNSSPASMRPVVATCGPEIANVVEKAGGRAIITDPALPSGTDRVWAAYVAMGKPAVDVISGLQGDLPLSGSPIRLMAQQPPYQQLHCHRIPLSC